jgi:hypothetical protein
MQAESVIISSQRVFPESRNVAGKTIVKERWIYDFYIETVACLLRYAKERNVFYNV